MTDGTSQGLFIVVAIVIFGIFVVMAYILFEDTLSPAMANMFSEATEQASMSFQKNLVDFNKITSYSIGTSDKFEKDSKTKTVLIKGDSGFEGLVIPNDTVEANKNYIFEFDIEILSGKLDAMGGHLWYSEHRGQVFINGVVNDDVQSLLESRNVLDYSCGVNVNLTEGKHHVKVFFDTNKYTQAMRNSSRIDDQILIQPNRSNYGNYEVAISNIKIYENK